MRVTMCEIFVILSLFLIFANVEKVSAPAQETQEPFVLVEQDDDGNPKNPHYKVPVCAVEDKSKHEMVYLPSGGKYQIIYACYPVTMDECATKDGNHRNEYCVFQHKPKCGVKGSYKYVIKFVLNKDGYKIGCFGNEKTGQLYRVGYDFKFARGDSADVDIYRFCFNETSQKTLYVEYKIISPNLLGTNVDNQLYTKSIDSTYSDPNIDLGDFGNKLKIINNPKDYKSNVPSLVVPKEHMALDWWKAPLFHIANVQFLRPDFVEKKYMEKINNFIRDKAKEFLGDIFIRAGVFDISLDMYDSYVWWKLIYNEKRTHAIALIIHNGVEPLETDEKYCNKDENNYCKDTGWEGLVPEDVSNLIMYCCDPDFLVEVFKFEKVKTLNLNDERLRVNANENTDCKIPILNEPASENDPPSVQGKKYGGYLNILFRRGE